jgi:hypothetical protein
MNIPGRKAQIGLSLIIIAGGVLGGCKKADEVDANSSPQGASINISRANFDKIAHGMTQQQVDDILGDGKQIPRTDTPALAGDMHRIYGNIDANQAIIVGFKNGKVVGKTCLLTDKNGQIWSFDG